jgi:hypothetical protein
MNPFDADSLLARFRRHPDEPGVWLFREEWPFGTIWALPGTSMPDPETRALFHTHRLTMLEGVLNPLGALWVLALVWQRRRWLRANGRRVRRALWRRAAPSG